MLRTGENIPRDLNFIWLGGLIKEEDRKNIENWRSANPDYRISLWIDSSLFEFENSRPEINELLKWAADNKVNICDVNVHPNADEDYKRKIKDRSDIFKDSPNRVFYEDEVNGQYRNLAAASDILRVEMLYKSGGIYFDAGDVLPSTQPLKNISAIEGFYCDISADGQRLNNDILASSKKREFITKLRDQIHTNYVNLYKDPEYLQSHRNEQLSSPDMAMRARLTSTVDTSGPGAVKEVISQMLRDNRFKTFTADDVQFFPTQLGFPHSKFQLPPQQAASWFGVANPKYEFLSPAMRNYFKIGLAYLLEQEGKNTTLTADEQANLNMMINYISKLPQNLSLTEVSSSITNSVKQPLTEPLQKVMDKMHAMLTNGDEFIKLLENKVDPKVTLKFLVEKNRPDKIAAFLEENLKDGIQLEKLKEEFAGIDAPNLSDDGALANKGYSDHFFKMTQELLTNINRIEASDLDAYGVVARKYIDYTLTQANNAKNSREKEVLENSALRVMSVFDDTVKKCCDVKGLDPEISKENKHEIVREFVDKASLKSISQLFTDKEMHVTAKLDDIIRLIQLNVTQMIHKANSGSLITKSWHNKALQDLLNNLTTIAYSDVPDDVKLSNMLAAVCTTHNEMNNNTFRSGMLKGSDHTQRSLRALVNTSQNMLLGQNEKIITTDNKNNFIVANTRMGQPNSAALIHEKLTSPVSTTSEDLATSTPKMRHS